MIDADRAADAAEFLVDSASLIGAAKAEAMKADDMLRHVKALAMAASDEKSAAAQERDAYASEQYRKAIETKFEAVKKAETLKAQREAASALIEYWRSANASQRNAERGFHAAR